MEIFIQQVNEDTPEALILAPTDSMEDVELFRINTEQVIAVRVYTAGETFTFRKKGVTSDELMKALTGKTVTEVLSR